MPAMRCKVRLSSLSDAYSKGVSVKFVPVSGDGSPENKTFHAATPGGSFEVTLSEQAAKNLGAFELGKEYYVDFVPVNE